MSAVEDLVVDDEWTVLQRVRQDARRLCRMRDSLMQPQYLHLLGRVEALIEIAGHEHRGPADADDQATPPTAARSV